MEIIDQVCQLPKFKKENDAIAFKQDLINAGFVERYIEDGEEKNPKEKDEDKGPWKLAHPDNEDHEKKKGDYLISKGGLFKKEIKLKLDNGFITTKDNKIKDKLLEDGFSLITPTEGNA